MRAGLRQVLFGQSDQLSFDLPLTTSLVPRLALGSPTPTFTRATTSTVTDFEGLLRTVKSGEARFEGARRVENFCDPSFGSSAYSSGIIFGVSTYPSIDAGFSDPLGGNSATRLTWGGSLARFGTSISSTTRHIPDKTGKGVFSIWCRCLSGVVTDVSLCLRSTITSGTVSAVLNITPTWTRYSISKDLISGAGTTGWYLTSSGTSTIEVFGYHLEDVTGQANQNPSEYVSNGVLPFPYHGAGVDGVRYFDTTNGTTVV